MYQGCSRISCTVGRAALSVHSIACSRSLQAELIVTLDGQCRLCRGPSCAVSRASAVLWPALLLTGCEWPGALCVSIVYRIAPQASTSDALSSARMSSCTAVKWWSSGVAEFALELRFCCTRG